MQYKSLKNNDGDLFIRDNHEVTITGKLSQYLSNEFEKYNVDIEYNKDYDDPKYDSNGGRIRPDIVVHKRGIDSNNLLCIELKKKSNNNSRSKDYYKLSELTGEDGKYGYKLGVFIDVGKDFSNTDIKYFINGEVITNFSGNKH